jgi:hypothetical protein
MKAQSRPTLVVHEPLPNKTIWSFQGLSFISEEILFDPNLKLKFQIRFLDISGAKIFHWE